MSKKKSQGGGIVYSTDPNYHLPGSQEPDVQTQPPTKQPLRIILDKKQRAGKSVTLVTGFIGQEKDLDDLGKKLKAFCGTGGSVKNGEVIIQGDQRDKVMQWLQKQGYTAAKRI